MSDANPTSSGGQPPIIMRVSPWIPREKALVSTTLEVVQITGTKSKVDIFKKPSEECGNGSNADKCSGPKA